MIVARADQTLEEHISSCLKTLNDLKRTNFWRLVENGEEILKVAVIFHDAGKIFYQTRKNLEKDKPSFFGHELFSTFILNEFLWNLEFERRSRLLAIAVVLYHHYAMGVNQRKNGFKKRFSKFIVCNSKEEFREILKEHEDIVLNFVKHERAEIAMKKVNERILSYIEDFYLKYPPILDKIEENNIQIWREFIADKNFRKLMLPSINAMTIVDYLSVKPGGKKTEFSRVIDEFVELYSKKIEIV